ncbi:cell envelope-related Asp23 family protein [Kribbella amoyensis]|uniref:Cell envelope-related Asp23 family protein n=1 Tax=Kribbella amoyensis TaxID=996641 RepID=A0A561BUQ2_9ACTN|nr:DUF6286 domain-containing protein [Kribbella amoyensis]TWD82523.1 cell envelope-related Asp23 family protein [Kribbella amoyensis]
MAETVLPAAQAPGPVAHGGDRGRLEIAQRAVERIAEITARQHGAVLRRNAAIGRGLPKARAVIAGRRTRLEVQVAAAWGHPLDQVAAEVRRDVTADVERLTGLGVDRVDVDVIAVAPATESASVASAAGGVMAARGPVAGPAASGVGVCAALVVIGVGVVLIGEMLSAVGLLDGPAVPRSWFGQTFEVEPMSWLLPAGIAVAVIGIVLLVATLKPRRRTHLVVDDAAKLVWIRPSDAARLAANSAARVDSVTGVSATGKGRRIRLTTATFGDRERVRGEVCEVVTERLRGLTPSPRLSVLVREE